MQNKGIGARTGSGNYLPALDGLRAVSILLVVLSHLGLDRMVPGAFGVTLFFFISGYLITRQLLQNLSDKGSATAGSIDLGGFYLRRALRLMPAGVVYIVVAGTLFQFAGGHISIAGWLAALGYGANYYDLWAGYRTSLPGVRHPFNILWSLAVEEHFYLLWPILLLVLRGRALAFALCLCGAVLAWRLYLLSHCFNLGDTASAGMGFCAPANPNPMWRYNRLYLPTDTRLDSIAWGAVLALLETRRLTASAWRALAGCTLLAASFAMTSPLGRYGVRPSLQGLGLVGLVPWLLWRPSPLRTALSTGPALLLGRLSYSLYLWHWAALGVADYFAPFNRAAWLTIAVPLSATLAGASYVCIERPMLRLRRRFGSHAPLTLSAVSPIPLAASGHAVAQTQGVLGEADATA
jgi:peptidoglycan/LPS O-acetylase OafA/YrhL